MVEQILAKLAFCEEDWEGIVSFPILGDEVLMAVEAPEDGQASAAQVKTLQWLHDNIESLHGTLEAGIFTYYQNNLTPFRKKLGNQADTFMPTNIEANQVWHVLDEPGIYLPKDNGEQEVHLEFECHFDEENGLRVIFKNGTISHIGV